MRQSQYNQTVVDYSVKFNRWRDGMDAGPSPSTDVDKQWMQEQAKVLTSIAIVDQKKILIESSGAKNGTHDDTQDWNER